MLGGDNMVNEKKRTESYSRGILGVPCPHLVWPKSPGVIRLIALYYRRLRIVSNPQEGIPHHPYHFTRSHLQKQTHRHIPMQRNVCESESIYSTQSIS